MPNRQLRRFGFALVIAAGVIVFSQPARGDGYSFTWLGKLADDPSSKVVGISMDRSTVLYESTRSGSKRIYRWTAATGLAPLGDLSGGSDKMFLGAISQDGSVIVGGSSSSQSGDFGTEPFRWSADTGVFGLGFSSTSPPPNHGIATSISGNGLVVGGWDGNPFVWSAAAGMTAIEPLDNSFGFKGEVNALNYDGTVAVGHTRQNGQRTAFRWTAEGGTQSLGKLTGRPPEDLVKPESFAFDVSADGSVIVGHAASNAFAVPMRWTAATGMVELPMPPGAVFGAANAVSADGTIAVGDCIIETPELIVGKATIWSSALGVQSIEDILRANGFDSLLSGEQLGGALSISTDGRTIFGYGSGPEGDQLWIATIPVPEPAAYILGCLGAVGLVTFRRRFSSRNSVSRRFRDSA